MVVQQDAGPPAEDKGEKKHKLKQRFQVIRKLGQGTYGKVQLAINRATNQEVSHTCTPPPPRVEPIVSQTEARL
ncbi:hypothetical protein HPB48_000327 [Haemaphysalis longicornis]|uniref:Uncharacterized protein n=1 Tax=Haemaphysalis longicornis TaxID=44386 RepID=A0A9J6FM51_HAELO|nr:hypothetical protein HPB48_000327 [Haemaphysalis longicornis]